MLEIDVARTLLRRFVSESLIAAILLMSNPLIDHSPAFSRHKSDAEEKAPQGVADRVKVGKSYGVKNPVIRKRLD
jgi:hypothetical protein